MLILDRRTAVAAFFCSPDYTTRILASKNILFALLDCTVQDIFQSAFTNPHFSCSWENEKKTGDKSIYQ